jgi:hypothetical protein
VNILAPEQEQKESFPNYRVRMACSMLLGRRGALAALHGMALPDPHQRLAMIYLALGALRADERFDNPYRNNLHHEMLVNRQLMQEVVSICTAQFGLSEQEAQQCVNSFGSDYNERRKRRTFNVADIEGLPAFLGKDQAPLMPSVPPSEGVEQWPPGEETQMTLAERLNALPRSARLSITPEFEIATGRTPVGFALMAPERAQRVVDNSGYLGYADKAAKYEGDMIYVFTAGQWSPTFKVQ